MTEEELDRRAEEIAREAVRRCNHEKTELAVGVAMVAAWLTRTGWKPPRPRAATTTSARGGGPPNRRPQPGAGGALRVRLWRSLTSRGETVSGPPLHLPPPMNHPPRVRSGANT